MDHSLARGFLIVVVVVPTTLDLHLWHDSQVLGTSPPRTLVDIKNVIFLDV